MKVLIIGSGGREYAIAKSLLKSDKIAEIFVAPGNGGTALLEKTSNVNIKCDNYNLAEFALNNSIDLTIVGPEDYLMKGIVDHFQQKGLKIFGPPQKSAMLEGSKAFAKDFMTKYNVKTAKYKNFTNYELAKAYAKEQLYPLVIKASGLASGKGVIICEDYDQAICALNSIMLDKVFGDAGVQVVIEEFLQGEEMSILCICNNNEMIPFISAKDHKRIGEQDTGLNTGGMGVIAPSFLENQTILDNFIQNIMKPTFDGMLAENLTFSGIVFFGVMVCNSQTYLLEYNMRMGDPETQALLPLLKNSFLDIVIASLNNQKLYLEWYKKHSCCVVLVSDGYPLNFNTGYKISGLDNLDKKYYDVAGAQLINNELVTSGGRVLSILGFGDTVENAREQAYLNVKKVDFIGKRYRNDIGVNYK